MCPPLVFGAPKKPGLDRVKVAQLVTADRQTKLITKKTQLGGQ